MRRLFRMITLKQILLQVCPADWFLSLDLKDAYFHIQIAPPTTDGSLDSPSREWLISILFRAVSGSPHFYQVHGLGLGTVHICNSTGIGTWNSVPVPNGTFFRYFTLCNNKNIYFSEKISPKLSISTFWTIGPYNLFIFFYSRNFCVFYFFLIIKWRHEIFIYF